MTRRRALSLFVPIALGAGCAARRPLSVESRPHSRSTAPLDLVPPAAASPEGGPSASSDGGLYESAAVGCRQDSECIVLDASRLCGTRDFKAVLASRYSALEGLHRRGTPEGTACDEARPDRREKVALCEQGRCTLYDEAVALRWVASLAPQMDDLVPSGEDDMAKAPWFHEGAHLVLHVRSDWLDERIDGAPRPRRGRPACTAVDFVAHDHALQADVDDAGRPAPRYGCHNRVTLAGHATLTRGLCEYPHGRIGIPVDDGSEPECLAGGHVLSTFDARGLAYDGTLIAHLTPVCAWETVELPGCEPASCRTCQITLERSGEDSCGGLTMMRGTGHKTEAHTRAPRPVCERREGTARGGATACLPDEHEALLPRMAHILSGRAYVERGDSDGLRLFRRKEDCDASLP